MKSVRTAEKIFMTSQNNNSRVYALILAGGKSSRMGTDKSVIEYHGLPQREYLFKILSPVCDKVFLSCRKDDDQIPSHYNPIADQFSIESPLNGILSAFEHAHGVAWLTVPIDMPLIDAKTISYLIENRDAKKIATCFFDSEGKNPEPLFTLWEPAAYSLLKKFYHEGKISPRDFLKQSDIKVIPIQDKKVLTNINSEIELKKFFSENS
jgi:molybdopterin-guanine dinucleotide biosynthesis protein A